MKITVAIPTKDPIRKWLQETIASCKLVDEIIVCDDCSKEAVNIADYEAPENVPIRIIRNEKNIGCFSTVNRLCAEVKEGFISAQADDDYFIEPAFHEIINTVRKTKADVVNFPCQYFGKFSFVFGNCPDPMYEELYWANNIYGASFFRKELWDFLGGFQLDVAGDWDFWLRALKSGAKFEFVNAVGAMFRVTDRSMFESSLAKLGRSVIDRNVRTNADKWQQHK